MPIYEYQCDKCAKVYEKIQKFSDPILTVCEVCGGPVTKLMGKPALQFKGSGFYITDYVRKGNSSEPAASGSENKKEKAVTETAAPKETSTASPAAASSESKTA